MVRPKSRRLSPEPMEPRCAARSPAAAWSVSRSRSACATRTRVPAGLGRSGSLEIRGLNLMMDTWTTLRRVPTCSRTTGSCAPAISPKLEPGGRRFRYVARQDDALRLGGYLVSPREIEAFIEDLDGVIAAQVVAADVAGATRPVAFIRGAEGVACDEAAIRDACAAWLARQRFRRAWCAWNRSSPPRARTASVCSARCYGSWLRR